MKMTIEKIAEVCHETNRAYCQALGDDTQLGWNDAPQWQKDSAVNGVNFHIDNPEMTPENSHENWLKEKTEAGWVYGETKDPDKKEHPCCVAYLYLPTDQKAKDHIFRSIVHQLK